MAFENALKFQSCLSNPLFQMNYSLVRACPQAEAYVQRERERERDYHSDCGVARKKNNVTLISARGEEGRAEYAMWCRRLASV